MFSIIFLAILCFGILGWTGYVLGRRVLKVRDVLALAGFVCSGGIALYIVFTNALAYILPFRSAAWAALGILGASTLALSLHRTSLPALERPPRRLLIFLLSVILLTGLAYMRDRGSDEWTQPHFALPATMLEGNFPPVDVAAPWEKSGYHYAPSLLVAAFTAVTGLPLPASQAAIPLLSVASIVLFAAAFGRRLSGSWGIGAFAGIMSLAASGFFWMSGLSRLLQDIRTVFFLHLPLDPPHVTVWRGVTHMIHHLPANAPLMALGHRPVSLGFAFTFALLWILFSLATEPFTRRAAPKLLLAILLGTALALTLETTLVLLLATLTVAFLLFFIMERMGKPMGDIPSGRLLLIAFLFSVPTLFIASVQGGPMSMIGTSIEPSAFRLHLDGLLYVDKTMDIALPIMGWTFWRNYGPHVLLTVLSTVFFLRRRNGAAIVLLLLAAAHFVFPLIFVYAPYPLTLNRLFYVTFTFASITGAVALARSVFASPSKSLRLAGALFVTCMLVAGTLNAAVRLALPTLRLERSTFFPTLPVPTEAEAKLYAWARSGSTLHDVFYIQEGEPSGEYVHDRLLFIIRTGRFAVGRDERLTTTATDREPDLISLSRSCDADAAQALGIRYLVLLGTSHDAWFRRECDPSRWKLSFGLSTALPRTYTLLPRP
ncbi:MAG: hypothetical protein PHW10_03205 [Candidatus Peribacteraceae bacterium]|nr:hypothetical protein [Candidatus Peribacteraceae bacterium]